MRNKVFNKAIISMVAFGRLFGARARRSLLLGVL